MEGRETMVFLFINSLVFDFMGVKEEESEVDYGERG